MNNVDEKLGLSSDLFVSRLPKGDSLVVGGKINGKDDESKWTRILSRRAAHLLWYRLTLLLFPEKAKLVTAIVATAPLRPSTGPTVTTHIEVVPTDDSYYDISGMMGNVTWWVKLSNFEARRLWAALDMTLYPDGWNKNADTETTPAVVKRRPQTYQ